MRLSRPYQLTIISLTCILLLATSLFADPRAARSAAEHYKFFRQTQQTEFHGRRVSSTLDETLLDEGFNSRVFPPEGWEIVTTNTNDPTYTWFAQDYLSPVDPHEGYFNAGVLWDSSGADQDEWLYSPVFALQSEPDSGITWNLTFRWMMSYYWGVAPEDNYDLQLWLSFDGGANFSTLLWTEDSVSTFDSPDDNFHWFDATVDMIPHAGHTNLRLGWHYVGADGAEAGIDEVLLSVPSEVIAFPDTSTVQKEIDVTQHITIEDLNIALNVTHAYISDVTFRLENPSELSVLLVQGAPAGIPVGSNFVGTIFDDQAEEAFAYTDESSPYTGRWRPAESLSIFNNNDAFGTWKLIATDESADPPTEGSINDVTLYINDFPDFDADTVIRNYPTAGEISDINVTLNVTHPMISEMYFILESPEGTQVQLVPEEHFNITGANFVETVFDDEADSAFAFIDNMSNYTGSWKPDGSLSDFDGEPSHGDWKLIGVDFVQNDNNGTIDDVDLDIEFASPVNDGNQSAIPASFRFLGNYPNPFNPSTSLSFELPVSAQVSLNIYNTLGQQVTELVNERMNAGSHSVQFDGVYLASGIYFVAFDADDFHATHKMILLK